MADKQLSEILNTAIAREQEAYAFYMDIHNKVSDPSARETIAWIAEEEQKHEAFLNRYRSGELGADALRMTEVVSYKTAEYLDEPEMVDGMKREEVFLLASHREKRSYQFYMELAAMHRQGDVREMLEKMANEELRHKEKMEYLYANTAFPQTDGG